MGDFYYELHDSVINEWDSKYQVVYSRTGDAMMAGGVRLTQNSTRIWKEDSNKVRFVKNRFGPDTKVDLKEFMWIKLKAQPIK